VAGNKRGSHLTLTLERLAHVAEQPVQRVGLSATQRPIEAVARLLVGAGPDRDHPDGTPRCAIVDSGHRRRLDLALELPDDELGAVPTTEQMAQILDMIAGHVAGHRTTLVFVNTRSMAERVAHQLGERLGDALLARGDDPPRPPREGRLGALSTAAALTRPCPSRKSVALTWNVSPATAFAGRRPQSTAGCTSRIGIRPITLVTLPSAAEFMPPRVGV